MLKSTIKTEIRVSPNGFEVWYSVDGGQTRQFHKRFNNMDDAVKETVSMKGYRRLLGDILNFSKK
jgi:hypothetical protein